MAINPHTGTTIAAGSNTGEVNVYDTEQDGMPWMLGLTDFACP